VVSTNDRYACNTSSTSIRLAEVARDRGNAPTRQHYVLSIHARVQSEGRFMRAGAFRYVS
jgi:hypothetical protein